MDVFQQFKEKYRLNDQVDLKAIGAAFSCLPYENVTKILKERGSAGSTQKLRMAEEVFGDHLRWNTGGTCFSLCNALLTIVENCGYVAHIAMADMYYGPNIHCAVIVTLPNNRYMFDPGYLLTAPVPIPTEGSETRMTTPMNSIVLRYESIDVYSLYTQESGEEKWRYRIRTNPVPREEFLQHWMHSFSLNSMEHVMMSRLMDQGRIYFRKDRLELVSSIQRRKRRVDMSALHELSEAFGVPADLIQQAQHAVLCRPS